MEKELELRIKNAYVEREKKTEREKIMDRNGIRKQKKKRIKKGKQESENAQSSQRNRKDLTMVMHKKSRNGSRVK